MADIGIQRAYQEAASVFSQTGVDPAIVATILNTEGPHGAPYSLGITTGAPGGKGTSGGSLPNSGGNFGGTQPSNFWSYQNGAEAAQALANYLKTGPPGIRALAQFASSASAFFGAGPAIYASGASGNYYVPTAGESSSAGGVQAAVQRYWNNWGAFAAQFTGSTFTPSAPTGDTSSVALPASSGGTTASGSSTPSSALDFGQSVQHVLIEVGLVVLALALFFGGVMLLAKETR